ncbi:hypothetical protein LJC55_02970 [Eubacteriales bacterium OttesenSCG-928-N14]|nr:hypothetical protein [Eubacteriales bacterium OttesenSCG-928-N14]
MKRAILLLLCTAFIICLAACGSAENATTPEPSVEPTPEPVQIPEPANALTDTEIAVILSTARSVTVTKDDSTYLDMQLAALVEMGNLITIGNELTEADDIVANFKKIQQESRIFIQTTPPYDPLNFKYNMQEIHKLFLAYQGALEIEMEYLILSYQVDYDPELEAAFLSVQGRRVEYANKIIDYIDILSK